MNNNPSKENLINQAIKFHMQGNIPEATLLYKQLIIEGCGDPSVFSNYGIILRNLGKLKEAEISYRKAIELKPDLAAGHNNLGTVLKDLGKLKEAELSISKATELDPDFAIAHNNLGTVLNDLRKSKDAESSYRKAIELNPEYAEAHNNLGILLNDLGNLKDAESSCRKAIALNPEYAEAHNNLGTVLKNLDKLQEAELSIRKAIELNPNFALAHSNLGGLLKDFGDFKEAEFSIRKAIKLNPSLAIAYFSLSQLKVFDDNKIWRDQLFSKTILTNNSEKDKVSIYFARANIYHRESNFKESSKCLKLANNLKKILYPSNFEYLLKRSKELMLESNKAIINHKQIPNYPESIFIVGMPRSGSTLLESILSINKNVYDLGEKNIFEESFLDWKDSAQKSTLADLYFKKTNINNNELRTTINKWLYNYQYIGIIANQIPSAKIIHCFRNPLDNILSIYRTNFAEGNEYSSFLVDCAKVYLDQEEVMTEYKKRFRSKIYDLNYDALVKSPSQEIKSLISWLGWKWKDKYLSPHLNPRSVSTASNVQVRYPINSKSTGVWKKYKKMLKPAIEIITQNNKYKSLKY